MEKDIKTYNSKLVIITGDFFLNSYTQISKEEKDWLYPQMIKALTKIKDSIKFIEFIKVNSKIIIDTSFNIILIPKILFNYENL